MADAVTDQICPVFTCPRPVGGGGFFCDLHWAALPPAIRETVVQTCNSMYASGGTDPGALEWQRVLRYAAWRAYELAG